MYARLGISCTNQMDVILSNTKFINPSDPVYKLMVTKMDVYPGLQGVDTEGEGEKGGGSKGGETDKNPVKKP